MNKYILFLFVILFCSNIFSQQQLPVVAQDDTTYYSAVEEMPEIIGGISAIEEKLHYSEEALKEKIEGPIFIIAYIDENGTVQKTKIIKGLGYGLDEIASNVMLHTKFKPGRQNGVPKKVQYSLPIIFKLD